MTVKVDFSACDFIYNTFSSSFRTARRYFRKRSSLAEVEPSTLAEVLFFATNSSLKYLGGGENFIDAS